MKLFKIGWLGFRVHPTMEERGIKYLLFNICEGKRISTFYVEVSLEGKCMRFSVGINSSFMLIPLEFYTKKFNYSLI